MENKAILIRKLMTSLFVIIFLLYTFINNTNLIVRVMIASFIVCAFIFLIKTILLLYNKKKLAKVMGKLYIIIFLLFWFSFIIFWSYLNIKDNNYIQLLFTIPFWLGGFYIIRKSFFKPKAVKKSKFNFKISVSVFLIAITFISGIAMLFFGGKEVYSLNKKVKDYQEVKGYFKDYNIYSTDEDGTTYNLIYTYTVEGRDYSISTNYGTGFIPNKNSERTIKYNPNNPEDAIILGTSNGYFLVFMGIIFTVVPSIILLGMFSVFGHFSKIKIDLIGITIGIILITIGFGAMYMLIGSLSIITMFKSYTLSYIIPFLIILMFIVVGIYQLVKSLFSKDKR